MLHLRYSLFLLGNTWAHTSLLIAFNWSGLSYFFIPIAAVTKNTSTPWITWSGSIFQSRKFPLNNLFICENWKLLIFAAILIFFNHHFLLLLIVEFLIWRFNLFQIKFFCLLFNWYIIFTRAGNYFHKGWYYFHKSQMSYFR